MKSICRNVQRRLAEGGAPSLQGDAQAQDHLETCAACFDVLESMVQLDRTLDALPTLDAPDALVESLVQRGEFEVPAAPGESASRARNRGLHLFDLRHYGLWPPNTRTYQLAGVMALLVLAASWSLLLPSFQKQAGDTVVQSVRFQAPASEVDTDDIEMPLVVEELVVEEKEQASAGLSAEYGAAQDLEPAVHEQLRALGYVGDGGGSPPAPQAPGPLDLGERSTRFEDRMDWRQAPETEVKGNAEAKPATKSEGVAQEKWQGTKSDITFRGASPRVESKSKSFEDLDAEEQEEIRGRLKKRLESLRQAQWPVGGELSDRSNEAVDGNALEEEASGKDLEGAELGNSQDLIYPAEAAPSAEATKVTTIDEMVSGNLAQEFLEERRRIEGVALQPATGYWANTYLPGDPVLRHLQSSLLARDASALQAFSEAPVSLHQQVQVLTQPFDAPEAAALAVYVQADRGALDGPGRMLLQVGLQASDRSGGRRPAMNVSLVLDLRQALNESEAASLRALLAAFVQQRDLGDRFRVFVAGRGGEGRLESDSFHHGPLTIHLEQWLEAEPDPSRGLLETMGAAFEAARAEDDPAAPLSSSAVLLVTHRALGSEASALAEVAHRSAVQGVPVSVIGVGSAVDVAELEAVSLAGQGQRRWLQTPQQASSLVERELAAVGRAVARAIRLRIRLAPGVELVDVVGSHRLDEVSADKVREAEKSLDQRLSRNLGIAADRGEDEDGVQIVIPSFYSGDSHVVLLDLIARGAGPIADVQVRFKDLLYLENGVATARLDLPRGESTAGPLEHNVLKNYLALEARSVFEQAAQSLRGGDEEGALRGLRRFRRLLEGLGTAVPGLAQDLDLRQDVRLFEEYLRLLRSGAVQDPEVRTFLEDSLRLSARLKVRSNHGPDEDP